MSPMFKKAKYDIAVIGGGAAGMMAAGRAAQLGASVILVEKNEGLGKKLLITGGGRCNVTNDTPDVRAFLAKLRGKGKFLFSTFAEHAVTESLDFFHKRGMETKVENEGRVFPVSNTARSVYDVLLRYIKEGENKKKGGKKSDASASSVEIALGVSAKGFHIRNGKVVGLNIVSNGTEPARSIVADSYILATGGTSMPETGSTGEGFQWLAAAGHTIIEPDSAMVPIKIAEKWVRDLSGVSNQNARLSLMENGKHKSSNVGRMVFAHFGLSGPLVINFSRDVREAMHYKQPGDTIELSLDICPDYDPGQLDLKIQEVFKANQNKKLKNALRDLVTPAIVSAIVALTKLDPEKEINLVTRKERLALGKLLKDLRMTPTGFLGREKAIVASGGVKLEEVDFKTMQSRLIPNLYLVGDVLDVERPSGGYSLQICWTTGWVAATSAVNRSV